jgi:very-short-patch-repair endonuclease
MPGKCAAGRRFAGKKFRRQQPIGNYILDFFCSESKLSIELDGSAHAGEESRIYDAKRTEFLRSAGIREIRFWNGDVESDLDGVLRVIADAIRGTPRPPHVGEEGA